MTSVHRELVARLVDQELRGWRAGWEAGRRCAHEMLTVAGFEAVTVLADPAFLQLKALLRGKGDSRADTHALWVQLAGHNYKSVVTHPDFPGAFVESVRAVWAEVRDEVMAQLDDCPARTSSTPQKDTSAPRRNRRLPAGRRGHRNGQERRF